MKYSSRRKQSATLAVYHDVGFVSDPQALEQRLEGRHRRKRVQRFLMLLHQFAKTDETRAWDVRGIVFAATAPHVQDH